MPEKIFSSLAIGFAIAAIPGAVFIETIRRTLTKNILSGIFLVFGEFVGHVLLFLLIFFGISQFLADELANKALYLAGAIILLWLGVNAFKPSVQNTSGRGILPINSSFLVGFGLSVTDPYIIGLWITLSGSYLSSLSQSLATFHIILISLGFFLFFFPLIVIAHLIGKKIPDIYLLWLSRIGGVILVYTSVLFFWKFIQLFL